METYRIRKAGWFMGKYFHEGTEVLLNDKQAKYAVMSGQIEPVNPQAKAVRPLEETKSVPSMPRPPASPRGEAKPKRDEHGEFSIKRRVGGTFGGNVKRAGKE
jgi:hypothetical protein